MARSKRDDMKRNIAQASNHMASAVLDINEVYQEFDQAATALEKAEAEKPETEQSAEISQHRKFAEYLKQLMISISKDRDHLHNFALAAWGLDEEQLRGYM